MRGSGIGLSLVKHIAEAHGGSVTVDSEPGAGAAFIVDIPLRRARARAERCSKRTEPRSNKRVLIVEDEPDIVRGLTDALEFEGFEVVSTGVGKDGVRVMRERGADCVILDLMLPDINGYRCARRSAPSTRWCRSSS